MGTRINAGPKTPVAPPGDIAAFSRNLDRILRDNLPAELNVYHVRVRMIAAASWAGGWIAENIWHHNAWGIRKGGWQGDYYGMKAPEYDSEGKLVEVPADKSLWRAYPGWREAVLDYVKVLSQSRYVEGFALLRDHRPGADREWFAALGRGGWYTDTRGDDQVNQIIGDRTARVRAILGEDSPADVGPPDTGGLDPAAVVVVGVLAAAVVLLLVAL